MGRDKRLTFRYNDDVEISYEVEGDGATPVVFLHGFAAALITWHDLRPLFNPDRYRLYLLDLKGFGFSSKPRGGRYAPEEQAAIVIAFLEALGLRQVVLAGHSLGGGIALLSCLATRRKGREELIGRLVLIDCVAYPQRLPRAMGLLRIPLLGAAVLHLLPVRFMVRISLNAVFHDRKAITAERIARYVTCFDQKGAAGAFIATCRQLVPARYAELAASYPGIGVPLLIIWGREDRIVPLSRGERLRSAVPGARLVIIAGCGHNPHEERPLETFAAIAEFLDSGEGPNVAPVRTQCG